MSAKIRNLQARKADQIKSARALTDKVSAESRDFTTEEQTQFDGYTAQISSLNAQIEREQLLASEEAGMSAAGFVEIPAAATVNVTENVANDPRRGFRSLGEFAQAVRSGSAPGTRPDQRLAATPGVAGNESSGADGGFAVPPEFSREIFRLSLGEASLIPMTDNTNVGGNSMVFPKDETTPWGTDGIRAYWQAEATAANATKPKLGTSAMRLHKLMALVPLTDELLADTSALDSYLPSKVGDSIRWKSNESILFGTGSGQPQGLLNSGATVAVAKENNQAAATVNIQNLANMLSRLTAGSLGRSIWMINSTVIPQLFQLTLGNYPIFLPIGGVQGQGGSVFTLFGRPVLISEHASVLGSAGDITLLDMDYYRTITKAGGMETATSMHLYFDADATAFRTTFRLDGQSKISNPIAAAKGSVTKSPFIQLATRA